MSEYKDRCLHFYGRIPDGYNWPNSAEGDLLKIGLREIVALEDEVKRQRGFVKECMRMIDYAELHVPFEFRTEIRKRMKK